MSPIRLHRWVFDVLSRLYPGRYFSRRLPAMRPKRRSVPLEVDQFDRRESPTSLFAVDPLTAQLVSFTALHEPLPAATGPIAVGQAASLSADRIGDLPAEQAYFSSQAGSLPYAQGQVGNLPPQDGVSSLSAANFSPNLEAIQNPQAPFLDPLGLDALTPPHSIKLPASDLMSTPSTIHDGAVDSGSAAAGARPTASSERAGFASPELSSSSPSAGLSLSVAPVSARANGPLTTNNSPLTSSSDFTFDSASRLTSPNGPGTVQSFSSPVSVSHKKSPDAMYVLDANKAIVVTPGTADNEFSNTAMDLRMQVSNATVSTYSWDLTNAPDTTGVSGTSTYNLTFSWTSFTGTAKTETIIAKQTPSGGSQVTQTLTFKVAGTDSPAWSSLPTTYGYWPNVLPPDALNTMQQTQQIFGCSCGDHIDVGLAAGDLQANVVMPAYNPGVSRLGLVYDSIAANTLPIFVTHFQIDPSQAVPPTVKAQLTLNGVAGTTVWYTTSSLNPGDIMEIPLQGDATSLSTGRYSYSIAVTANYGTPVTTTYSGNVDIVNSSGSPFGAGWTLNNLERIWPVTGGVVLEEPRGLSLWFANGQPAGNFVRPAGDFSTLSQNTQTNVYTRTMPDGTKINFDSTGKQTSIVDRVGNTTSFGYNGSNLLVTITDPYSLITTLTYNASNKVSTIQNPALRTTTLAYDVNNVKLTSVTDPDSDLWQFGYDSANRMTTSTDEDSHLTTYAYGTGRVTTITRADSTTMLLTPVQLQGIPAAGTGTQSNPATSVLAVAAVAAYTDPRSNIWNTNLDWLGFGEPSQQTDPLSDLANTYRDANGLPWLAADPLARRIRSFFDGLANPTKTVFADDNYLQATYNTMSEPLTQTDELGNVTTMVYDTNNGNLLTVTQPDPDGAGPLTSPVTTNTYDSHGFVLTTTDPNSHTTTFGYDSRDRLTSRTDALNHTATMGYDSASNMTGRTDANGHVVTYTFDSDNRMQTQTLPGSPVSTTTFGYDAIGNLTSVTDPLGHITTNTYDVLNRLKTVTDPLSHTTTYGYDNAGNIITVTDPLSRITTYTFDNANRVTAVTDPLSHTTTNSYDTASQLISVTDPLSHTTTYTYSSRGFLLTKTDPLTNTTTYGYNSSGDRTNATWSAQSTTTNETTTTTYDNLHRQTSYTDPLNVTTTNDYDSVGNLTTITGPGTGNVITYSYDADNRLISVTDQLSHTTTYGYDNVGNRVTVTDALSRITTSTYDSQNRLLTVTDPLLGVTTYVYDVASRQTSITDSIGNTTTYSYDNANRLINVTDPNSHLTTYVYDNADELTSQTDRNSRQTTYSYDNAGRRTGETWVGGSFVATFTYDAANRLTVENDTFSKYTLGYDNADRLTSVDNLGTPNAPRFTLTYTLDIFGNRTTVAGNVGGSVINTFDLDNHLTFTKITSGLHGAKVTLTYDSRNRLSSITRGQPTISTNPNTTFSYDNADRLTGITHSSSAGGNLAVLTYGYDSANQLTSYNGPEGNLTYTYDVDGQLTNVGGARIETYTYDKEGNRTMTGYSTGTGNRLTADGTYTYSYDSEGNMVGRTKTSNGEVTTFTWDFRNRLKEVLIKSSGGTTLQDDKFTYDIENRRIGKNTLSGGQSWTGYDGVNPFADFNSSGALTFQYLYGNAIDFLLARLNTSFDPTWYLTDKLGSVRLVVNSSGSVIDTITYDSYGNITNETSPSNGDRFKFTSREWDSEIGQYFYRARYYNPGPGRFDSEDPVGFEGGDANLYRYVTNEPTDYSDPSGLWCWGGWFFDCKTKEKMAEVERMLAQKRQAILDNIDILQKAMRADPRNAEGNSTIISSIREQIDTDFYQKMREATGQIKHLFVELLLFYGMSIGMLAAGVARFGRFAMPRGPRPAMPAQSGPRIHSRYADGTPVYEGQQPPRLPPYNQSYNPAAQGNPHTVLRYDTINGRTYQAREYGVGNAPIRDIDFTNPTFPNGTPMPGHYGPPHQHPWTAVNPSNPAAGYSRGDPYPYP